MIRKNAKLTRLVACLTMTLSIVLVSASVSAKTDETIQCGVIQDGAKRLVYIDNSFYLSKSENNRKVRVKRIQ
jgi:hypothetical protein